MPLPEHTWQNVADSDGFDVLPLFSNEAPFNAKSSFSSGHVSSSPKDGSKKRSQRDDFEMKNPNIFIPEITPTHWRPHHGWSN